MTSLLQKELGQLEKQLLTLTAVVEESVQKAIKALAGHDRELAQKVIDNDVKINRLEVDLEEECLKVLALHQPVASDLRMIVVVLKINNDLETDRRSGRQHLRTCPGRHRLTAPGVSTGARPDGQEGH